MSRDKDSVVPVEICSTAANSLFHSSHGFTHNIEWLINLLEEISTYPKAILRPSCTISSIKLTNISPIRPVILSHGTQHMHFLSIENIETHQVFCKFFLRSSYKYRIFRFNKLSNLFEHLIH